MYVWPYVSRVPLPPSLYPHASLVFFHMCDIIFSAAFSPFSSTYFLGTFALQLGFFSFLNGIVYEDTRGPIVLVLLKLFLNPSQTSSAKSFLLLQRQSRTAGGNSDILCSHVIWKRNFSPGRHAFALTETRICKSTPNWHMHALRASLPDPPRL